MITQTILKMNLQHRKHVLLYLISNRLSIKTEVQENLYVLFVYASQGVEGVRSLGKPDTTQKTNCWWLLPTYCYWKLL